MALSPPLPLSPSPLPSTVMERYLARPSHGDGMVFSITLVLDGAIEIESLRQAWFATLHQHPRTHARLVGRGRRQRWERQSRAADASFVYRTLAAEIDDAASVCPRAGTGLKCVIQSSDQHRWSIRLLFHHACCDGVGAIRLIGQIFNTYSQAESQLRRTEPSGDNVDRRLRPSGETPAKSQPAKQTSSAPPTQLPDLKNLWATIRGTNVRLSQQDDLADGDCKGSDRTPDTGAAITTFEHSPRLMFSRSMSDQIRDALQTRKITLNDWAIAVTLHALAVLTRSTAAARRHVMIMNPVEMRTWAQRRDINNHVGIAFVRRTHFQLTDIHKTMELVSEQMQNVRRYGTANELASGIALAERIPGCLGLFERWGTFTPTATVTSVAGLRLGKRFGVRRQNNRLWVANAELVDVFFEGPVQCGGQVSTTIWEFERQIAVSNRTIPGVLDIDANHRLLRLWASIATQSCEPVALDTAPQCAEVP